MTASFDRARRVVDEFEARAAEDPNRKKHGVYYTPPELVEAMLDRVPLAGSVLDPAAGAGAFVLAIARRLGLDGLARVHACDVDARALDACARSLEAWFGDEAKSRIASWRRTNAHVADFLRTKLDVRAELVVGNPPYGLSGDLDLATLFPDLRGEIDLYACFLVRALATVAANGTVALLVPDTWMTNRRAEALRRMLVERTSVARVVDFGKPFATAKDTRVHALVLRTDARRCEVESLRDGRLETMAPVSKDELVERAGRGWFLYRTSAEAKATATLEKHATPISASFEVLYGLRTGDNARHVEGGSGAVPLVGGRDFEAFDRHVEPRHLVDGERFARTIAKQRGRWKIGIQRIRTNSRVPWRRWLEAALLTPDEVGLDSLTLVAGKAELDDGLCALLGVLNSSILNRWYRLGFTDVNVKPVYVEALPMPPLGPELAGLVRRRLATPGDLRLERAIDRLVADAYGLDESAVDELERSYWADELARRPLPTTDEARALANAPEPYAAWLVAR